MERENKAKRPRITLNKGERSDAASRNYEKVDYNTRPTVNRDGESRPRTVGGYNSGERNNNYRSNSNYGEKRPYTPRNNNYNNGGGNSYGTRSYGNNNNGGGDQEKNYNNEYGYNDSYASGLGERSYNPNRNYNQQRSNSGGGYNSNRNSEGGNRSYGNSGGGYNSNRNSEGGNRSYGNSGGGYNSNRNSEGGNRSYGNNGGGYNSNRNSEGGSRPYNNNGGGYRSNSGGGYNNNRNSGGNRPYNNNNSRPQRRDDANGTVRQPIVLRKKIVYDNLNADPSTPVRLNKFMANAGVCSRREADEHIKNGLVTVNGVVMSELGTKITYGDKVEFNGKDVTVEQKVYVLLNKPKDCVTTSDDPQGRLTVMDIVRSACTERIYPVGRLDRQTTGVLLLTNDGDLASKLTHPKFLKKKIYHVWTDKDVTEEDMQRIADGVELEDGPICADAVSYATEIDKNQIGIEIHSGRNRIVRRMFEALGYRVVKLDRVYFAGLTKKNLPRGRWRYLSQKEVDMLRMGAFE